MSLRPDLAMIAGWVPKGAHVLDLGCGNGELLRWLAQEKGCTGYGVEINHQAVEACVRHGVHVVQANIDEGLSLFSGTHFDVVVLSQALQATHQTERVLKDIAGLGREAIVSIPNFGHISHVWSLLRGHMPVNQRLPYQWYDTPNLHFATTQDFEDLLGRLRLQIVDRGYLAESADGQARIISFAAKLRATLALYRFKQ
jgi:methionine biosynthesis protein MetW